MNKDNVIDTIDEIIPKEKQIHVDLPQAKTDINPSLAVAEDYHTLLKDLILMALPSPSQHIH